MINSLLNSRINNIEGDRVLVAPLNWGIGHATRSIPIIRALIEAKKEVLIAADGYPMLLLKEEFPNLKTIEFGWADVKYSKSNSQIMAIIKQIPKFLYCIKKEHHTLNTIIKDNRINVVISDNRFGLWNKKVKSIYITHQIAMKVTKKDSWLNKMAYLLHKFIINKYDECWVPDFEGDVNLSGELSHKYPLPQKAYFIGILSRFS